MALLLLTAFLHTQHLAPYKTPLLDCVEEFPMTPSGKIQKFRLHEDFTRRYSTA